MFHIDLSELRDIRHGDWVALVASSAIGIGSIPSLKLDR